MRLKFGNNIHVGKLVLSAHMTPQQLENYLAVQDIIFVGGGNTQQMLEIWEHDGLTLTLNKLKDENRMPLLAGVSAGGMYPFNSGLSDSTPGEYKVITCMDWLKQSFCPHSDSKIKCHVDGNIHLLERMQAYIYAIKTGLIPSGYAVPDNCILHFYNYNLVQALTTTQDDNCFYVSADSVEPITTLFLNKTNTPRIARDVLTYLGIQS